MRLPETLTLRQLIERGGASGRVVATRDHVLPLERFARASSLGAKLRNFEGRNVLLFVRDMAKAAAALIDLDGLARRIVLCPPGWDDAILKSAAREADADALVCDGEKRRAPRAPVEITVPCRLPLQELVLPRAERRETEWILPTSGTSGPPKLVRHTLRTLTGPISDAPLQQWATFYDIRRYGGLQIFLRALAGKGSLHVRGPDEDIASLLSRFGAAGVHAYLRHSIALAPGAGERRGPSHRSRICQALRRNR